MPTRTSALVLVVADLFHPIDVLAAELFLNGDMAHGCRCCGAVPVLFAGRKPNDIAGPNFFDRAALTLHLPAASGDDQSLAKRMRVPRRASTRLKGNKGH
jgi:hypothetical protein